MKQVRKTLPFRRAIRDYLCSEFRSNESFFCVIYGSHAYGCAGPASDLDLLIACQSVSPERIARAVEFVIQLHHEIELQLDFEIPYEKKIMVSFDYLEKAIDGCGFRSGNGKWFIPPIIKDPGYLASDELLLRFLLGLMVHKHLFVAGDLTHYQNCRRRAEEMLITAICSAREITELSIADAVETYTSNGVWTGDHYLGFDNSLVKQRYLRGYFSNLMPRLERDGLVTRTKSGAFSVTPLLARHSSRST